MRPNLGRIHVEMYRDIDRAYEGSLRHVSYNVYQGCPLLTMSLDAVGSTAVRVLKDLVQLSATRHL
jgi:hypothetical protein